MLCLTGVSELVPTYIETTTVNNIAWTYRVFVRANSLVTNTWVELTSGVIGGAAVATALDSSYNGTAVDPLSGTVEIPSSINGYPVRAIGSWAFCGCSKMNYVKIPNSVCSIGYAAFQDCTGLLEVTIPSSVWAIGYDGPGGLFDYKYTRVVLGNGLYAMSVSGHYDAYGNAVGIIHNGSEGDLFTYSSSYGYSFNIDALKNGDYGTFRNCTSLRTVTIEPTTALSYYSFAQFVACLGNTSMDEYDVRTLGDGAFRGCSLLEEVSLADIGVIGDLAFNGCSQLALLNIPVTTKKMTGKSFLGYYGDFTIDTGNRYFKSRGGCLFNYSGTKLVKVPPTGICTSNDFPFCQREIDETNGVVVTYSDEVETNIVYTFEHLHWHYSESGQWQLLPMSFESYIHNYVRYEELLKDVEEIGDYALADMGCTSAYTYITVQSPDGDILYQQPSLIFVMPDKSETTENILRIPSSRLRKIGKYAFSGAGYTGYELPSTVSQIGEGAFWGNARLKRISIPDLVPLRGAVKSVYATWNEDVVITNEDWCVIVDSKTVYNHFWGDLCDSPLGVTFSAGTNTYVVVAGENNTARLFAGCMDLGSVELGTNVTAIGTSMFADCSSLSNIVYRGALTEIGGSAFEGCSSLTSFAIPSTVVWVAQRAFAGCSSLTDVVFRTKCGSPLMLGDYNAYGVSEGGLWNITGVDELGNEIREFCPYPDMDDAQISESAKCDRSLFLGCRKLKRIKFCGDAPSYGMISRDLTYDVGADYIVELPVASSGWDQMLWYNQSVNGVMYTQKLTPREILGGASWCEAIDGPETLTITDPGTAQSLAVPVAWLDQYGVREIAVQQNRMSSSGRGMLASNAVSATTGLPRSLYTSYVAGLDPTNSADVFCASIVFSNQTPVIVYAPDLGTSRNYRIWGKTNLTDAVWHTPTNSASRFFRVTVEMPR